MPEKTVPHHPTALPAELAARDNRWQAALAEAEAALAAGEPLEAERRAKALSAIAKAAADIAQWKQQALALSSADETEDDGESFRRELELCV
jgi:hypothetical protein